MCEKELLLSALKAGVRGERVSWDGMCSEEDGVALYTLACEHHVQALVLEAIYGSPDFGRLEEQLRTRWKQEAKAVCIRQTLRDDSFGSLYSQLEQAGFCVIVMKGCVCRSLYPNPGLRPSSDEDLLVRAADFFGALQFLREAGLQLKDCEADVTSAFEIGLISPQGLYIELHRSPFDPDSAVVGQMEDHFAAAHHRSMTVPTAAGAVRTMSAYDHMLYLLLHAYKHFIHSGFGVRQVCDIALWAENWGHQIDWDSLFRQCESLRCAKFAKTLFAAAREYLGFDAEKAGLQQLLPPELPVQALLEDMLGAGVFGSSTGSRVHSATITLNAVEADRQGKKTSVLRTVFPRRQDLQGRYPYLRRYPVLLPVAWCSRLAGYAMEAGRKDNSAAESLELGTKRKELLRSLDIID